jgi:hypothetical protein
VTWRRFHGHDVALRQIEVIVVAEVSLACIFELNLHHIGEFSIAWHVGQIVVCIELLVLPSAPFGAEASQAFSCFKFVLHLYQCANVLM